MIFATHRGSLAKFNSFHLVKACNFVQIFQMKPLFIAIICLFFIGKNAQAQRDESRRIHGTIVLSNQNEIQTGKISFIVGDNYYFNTSEVGKSGWVYYIPLDSLSSYEHDKRIPTYKFSTRLRIREGLRFYRRFSYSVTITGVMVGILSSMTPTMSTSSLIATLGFASGISGLGVYLCVRSIKKTIRFFEYESAIPYLNKVNTTSVLPRSNP